LLRQSGDAHNRRGVLAKKLLDFGVADDRDPGRLRARWPSRDRHGGSR
jgi:hypothetical protein